MSAEGDLLLKETFDIMACNDPRQPVLARVAAYLARQGFAMGKAVAVDDTHRLIVDVGNAKHNYFVEIVTPRAVDLHTALNLSPEESIPGYIVETSVRPAPPFRFRHSGS